MSKSLCLLALTVAAGLAACSSTSKRSAKAAPTTVAAGDADAASAAQCQASAEQCCQPDGTLATPTCAPVVRKPSDSLTRGPDGRCAPCLLRCLPPSARIRTPDGERAIDTLRAGELVMTADTAGAPRAMPILQVHANPVLAPHTVVVITLADGRSLRVSPGHPARDGSPLGDLRPGGLLDGAAVVSLTREPYHERATWDLLPAGPTGAYWADGILIGSTLRAAP